MAKHELFTPQRLAIAAITAIGAAICILICRSALQVNGGFGFPLDDPWIHLQFARTLREYGRFSYFANEMITSGSTSPLYTLLLAAGFFVTSNEMILSYALGIAFFAAGALVLSRIAEGLFRQQSLPVLTTVGLFLLERRLQWAALSGMETTLFILLLLLTWHLYRVRSGKWLGISAGLLLWSRPEAVIFFAILALDAAYQRWWVRPLPVRKGSPPATKQDIHWLYQAIAIAGVLCLGYAAFNLVLSGSLLPNTYAAKTAYYGTGRPGFSAAVFAFLTDGHMPVIAVLAAVAVLDALWKGVTRARQEYLVPVLWCIGLCAAYAQKLPFLYQEGRYLMPILPFVILLGVHGIELSLRGAKTALGVLRRKEVGTAVAAGASLLLLFQFGSAAWEKHGEYVEQCKYISDRQVKAALWIRDNLPADAVIGTHDVGAIAFYSGRRIVDMVGLVSPAMIENIGSFDRLTTFLARSRVTHLALLRNWFELVNQTPLFQTDERIPEIMEVFAFDPSRCHFTPQNASSLSAQGGYYLGIGQVQQAGPLLEESLRIDPGSARPHFYLGLALMSVGKTTEAERHIRSALELQPDMLQATLALAHIHTLMHEPDSALNLYKQVEQRAPDYAPVYRALSNLYLTAKKDSAMAKAYMEKYTALTQGRP